MPQFIVMLIHILYYLVMGNQSSLMHVGCKRLAHVVQFNRKATVAQDSASDRKVSEYSAL